MGEGGKLPVLKLPALLTRREPCGARHLGWNQNWTCSRQTGAGACWCVTGLWSIAIWGQSLQRFCQCYKPSRNRQPNSRSGTGIFPSMVQVSSCIADSTPDLGLFHFLFLSLFFSSGPAPRLFVHIRLVNPVTAFRSLARCPARLEFIESNGADKKKKTILGHWSRNQQTRFRPLSPRFCHASIRNSAKNQQSTTTNPSSVTNRWPDCSLFCGDLPRALPQTPSLVTRSSHATIQKAHLQQRASISYRNRRATSIEYWGSLVLPRLLTFSTTESPYFWLFAPQKLQPAVRLGHDRFPILQIVQIHSLA